MLRRGTRFIPNALLLTCLLGPNPASAFEFPHVIHQDNIKLELFPRSPEQIASFYEARGFPKAMIDELTSSCFITVRIHNQRHSKLWLELDNWTFIKGGTPIRRHERNELLSALRAAEYPAANVATFRWTLLPETLDYLPDEQESGNVLIDSTAGKIELVATFATGDDKRGKSITIRYDELECAR